TDIFKINVNAIRDSLLQLCLEIRIAAINGSIKAKLVTNEVTFIGAADNAYHATALELGHLADHRPDCATCRRNHDRLARLWVADLRQTVPGCKARHPEHTECVRRTRHFGRQFCKA